MGTTSTKTKYVYFVDKGKAEGKADMKTLLGGKGANLAEMSNAGLPVPPSFTITTEACDHYYQNKQQWPDGLKEELDDMVARLEVATERRFGDPDNPLLVSVRSGAAVSMPGMMDTVLNLGINDDVVEGLIRKTGNARWAWDCYRRFIDMFGDVVMGVDHEHFEQAIHAVKEEVGVSNDNELNADQLHDVVNRYKAIYRQHIGRMFPTSPREQLDLAINAVFGSWNSERAIKYRQINKITGLLGTAVNICTMVFGNMGETSGTGVCFTRDPSTGENVFYGEYLINAQGEDVVAGIRTPEPISALEAQMPEVYRQLCAIREQMEKHYADMQDMEFTVQEGKLYILQTRSGKRTGVASVRIAVEMVGEGLIDEATAVSRVAPDQLAQLLLPRFDEKQLKIALGEGKQLGRGLPAGPGAAVGRAVFTADEAEAWVQRGEKVILVRVETSPEDVGGMYAAEGILTSRGGLTSHAAVVARQWGKCCVAGSNDIVIDYSSKSFTNGKVTVHEGDVIAINGWTGEFYAGDIKVIDSPVVRAILQGDAEATSDPLYQIYARFNTWVESKRQLGVRTNADSPTDAARARAFGAQGIGLCRTEHMFFEGDRIISVRRFILVAEDVKRLKELHRVATVEELQAKLAPASPEGAMVAQFVQALNELMPLQRGDFEGIFSAMDGLPVTVRLLDPPLHEFVPHEVENQAEMAKEMGVSAEHVKQKVEALHEFNPMLGHRGCRLGVTYPELYDMQVRAIMEAACNVKKKGVDAKPEIMIPLVGFKGELDFLAERAEAICQDVMAEKGVLVDYLIGTMIEVPRAALVADEIAQTAKFFSFGTNDLTQMGLGFSRDDAGKFTPDYLERKVFEDDPFATLDIKGIGKLVKMGVELGRAARADLKVGICGEHGGDPATVEFCHTIGMNYVSCSPFRVAVARLAAAQAAIKYSDPEAAKKGQEQGG
ncbi:MAG: pyruvate, phosphate dikinase [Armatimonadetes bacterium]|nr:pyruvate, phosphate dikinase [Armatimonadota bacterium]